jgi:hypothetical protein
LTSSEQLRANRADAAASTGPRTKIGKSRSAKNALRHGLNIPVASDSVLAPRAEEIARKILGASRSAELLEWARRIGDAQVDLERIRSLRHASIIGTLADPRAGLSIRSADIRFLGRFLRFEKRGKVQAAHVEMINRILNPQRLEGDVKLGAVLTNNRVELARFDRYERRALSRRKMAIRSYDATRSLEK